LPDENAGPSRQERLELQNEEVEVSHVREHNARAEAADKPKDLDACITDSAGMQTMNRDPAWKRRGAWAIPDDQRQMNLEPLRIEMAG
jgi:hypothetical protein